MLFWIHRSRLKKAVGNSSVLGPGLKVSKHRELIKRSSQGTFFGISSFCFKELIVFPGRIRRGEVAVV